MKGIFVFIICIVISLSSSFAQSHLPYPLDTIDGKIYYLYTIERGIGLYRIGVNFGVSQEDILAANPQIQKTGLHFKETILIPAKELTLEIKTDTIAEEASIPTIFGEDIPEVEDNDSMQIEMGYLRGRSEDTIRLAVMLPLQADAIQRDKSMDRFYDFYAGILMAVNKEQQQGQRIEVYTYDTGKTTQKIEELLTDSTWTKVDAIIGPAYNQQVTMVSDFVQRDSTWLLVPFLSNVSTIESNPYIIQFNPSTATEANTFASHLKEDSTINCVLIENSGDENIPQSIAHLHHALKENNISTTTTSIRKILADSLEGAFVEGKENIVIFNTEKYNNLQGIMPHLLKGYSKYHITLYSQYSWQDEKIILPQIYTSVFKQHCSIPSSYEQMYQEIFGHKRASSRPYYDLLGYDLTSHLLHMLQQATGRDRQTSIKQRSWHGIQANIHYNKTSSQGGYENNVIHIIRK